MPNKNLFINKKTKEMKKILFGFLVLIIGNSALSQNCQYVKNEVDKFTKSTVKTTKDLLLAGGSYKEDGTLYASLTKIDSSRFLNIKLIAWKDFVLETNGKMMFLFDDDSVINLSFVKFAVGEYDNNSGLESWTASTTLAMSDENYNILRTKKPEEIRIYLEKGYVDLPIPKNKKYWNKFKEILECIK